MSHTEITIQRSTPTAATRTYNPHSDEHMLWPVLCDGIVCASLAPNRPPVNDAEPANNSTIERDVYTHGVPIMGNEVRRHQDAGEGESKLVNFFRTCPLLVISTYWLLEETSCS